MRSLKCMITTFRRESKSLVYKTPYDAELNFLRSSLIQCPIGYHTVADECLWQHIEIKQIQIFIRTCIRLQDALLTEKLIENTKTKNKKLLAPLRNCEINPLVVPLSGCAPKDKGSILHPKFYRQPSINFHVIRLTTQPTNQQLDTYSNLLGGGKYSLMWYSALIRHMCKLLKWNSRQKATEALPSF